MADDRHLSRIETLWSVVRQAHDDGSEVARTAQDELLERYGGAARRYLLAALREENAADEVFQEFALIERSTVFENVTQIFHRLP